MKLIFKFTKAKRIKPSNILCVPEIRLFLGGIFLSHLSLKFGPWSNITFNSGDGLF